MNKFKRALALALALVMSMSLVACGGDKDSSSIDKSKDNVEIADSNNSNDSIGENVLSSDNSDNNILSDNNKIEINKKSDYVPINDLMGITLDVPYDIYRDLVKDEEQLIDNPNALYFESDDDFVSFMTADASKMVVVERFSEYDYPLETMELDSVQEWVNSYLEGITLTEVIETNENKTIFKADASIDFWNLVTYEDIKIESECYAVVSLNDNINFMALLLSKDEVDRDWMLETAKSINVTNYKEYGIPKNDLLVKASDYIEINTMDSTSLKIPSDIYFKSLDFEIFEEVLYDVLDENPDLIYWVKEEWDDSFTLATTDLSKIVYSELSCSPYYTFDEFLADNQLIEYSLLNLIDVSNFKVDVIESGVNKAIFKISFIGEAEDVFGNSFSKNYSGYFALNENDGCLVSTVAVSDNTKDDKWLFKVANSVETTVTNEYEEVTEVERSEYEDIMISEHISVDDFYFDETSKYYASQLIGSYIPNLTLVDNNGEHRYFYDMPMGKYVIGLFDTTSEYSQNGATLLNEYRNNTNNNVISIALDNNDLNSFNQIAGETLYLMNQSDFEVESLLSNIPWLPTYLFVEDDVIKLVVFGDIYEHGFKGYSSIAFGGSEILTEETVSVDEEEIVIEYEEPEMTVRDYYYQGRDEEEMSYVSSLLDTYLPDLIWEYGNGDIGNLSDLDESRYILEFVSPSCGYCKESAIEVNKFRNTTGNLVISLALSKGDLTSFIENGQEPWTLTNYSDEGVNELLMNIPWVPAFLYIENGMIKLVDFGRTTESDLIHGWEVAFEN